MQIIVSRAVLISAISLFGYFIVNGSGAAPSAIRPAVSEVDFAQLASQLTSRPTIPMLVHSDPEPPEAGTVRLTSADDCISLVPNPSITQANLRNISKTTAASDINPFQFLSPRISATAELIPGRWKARDRLLVQTREQAESDSDPWISGLQTSQLDWRIDSLAPLEIALPERPRSGQR